MATFDINNTARRAQYTSTGQAGPFAFNFQVNASSELKVYINDVEKTETTHYTVSLNANGTGSVTFTTATTSGELITIIGDQPLSRTTVFQVGQANNPTTLETEFDNVIIRQQQIKEITDRALQLKPSTPRTVTGSGTSGPIYWPYDATAANNANKVIKYDSAGTGLELGPTTTDISTIAGIAADVTTVSGIAADVTAVAADATDIGIVSSNISSVQTVATNINDVITVANDLNEAVSEVETVANDLNEAVSEIDTVGNNITYVQTVGDSTNIANITTVAGQITPTNNISTVATISNDITQAATDSADIQTVASDSADIRTLADIEDGTVATNAVSNAGNNSTNITTVAGQISPTNNISTVAAAAPNIATVAGQISPTNNISTVAGANANISTIASNLTGANTIGTVATDLSGSNTIGTVATNIISVQDVASNISGVNSFAERYRVGSSDPTTSLDAGDLAFNTTGNVFKYYDGSSWQVITAGGITDIVQDSTPQLGGNLDLNSNDITGTGNVNITGNVSLTGTVDGRNIATDGTKLDTIATSATANPNAIDNVVEDTTPQLGGNLDLNSSDITGTGNVNITGTITSSGDITTSGVLNSIAPTRHSIRPSLNLDFANSKALDPRITFTRASNATYYDGYTSVKAEENLYINSQALNSWSGSRLDKFADDTTAPDGTTTADRLQQISGNVLHGYIGQSPTVVSGLSYTQSGYFKAGTNRNFVAFYEALLDSTVNYTWFNLSTGAVGTSDAGHTATITDVGNGWYRCSITYTANGNRTELTAFFVSETDGSGTVTDDQGFIYGWGLQFEQRDSLTAYTSTTTSPITKYQPALQTAGNNVARFDHNPTTGESLGLLIEESRTNLFTYSEEFDNGAWYKSNSSITANTILAPDGTLTADKVIPNTVSTGHSIQRTYTTTANTNYTMSVYLKKGEYKYVRLHWGKSGSPFTRIRIIINLDDGSFTNTDSGTPTSITTRSVTDVGNGWYRCSLGGIFDTTSTDGVLVAEILDDSQNVTHTGNDYSGLYFWGAQLEQASFPTSYIKTTGSQVTRSVDSASMTGTNFTNFFSSQVGTLLAHFGKINEGDTEIGERLITIYPDNNTVKYNLEGYRAEVRYSSSWDSQNFNNETRAGGKVAMAFDETGFISASNGVSQGTTTRVPYTFKATRMYIGSASNNGQANACIQKIAYYPIRLTSNELVDLTEE